MLGSSNLRAFSVAFRGFKRQQFLGGVQGGLLSLSARLYTKMTMRRNKIGLVGGGMIGANLALLAVQKNLADVVIYDVVKDMPAGKALDLNQLRTVNGGCCKVKGSNEYKDLEGCDVVIVTAGITRASDGSWNRDQLIDTNSKIITEVAHAIKKHCQKAFVIVITNPLDVMVGLLQKEAGLPANMVCGMAGVLDSSRFRYFVAEKLNVSVADVNALVMGGHGDTMVSLPRYCSIRGIPLCEFIKMGKITQKDVDDICERTRNGGSEIVGLLKQGSAFYAPAAAAIEMAQSFLYDEKRLLPCAAYLTGQFGVKGLYVGVPTIIGQGGVEHIVEVSLSKEEQQQFDNSVLAVKTLSQKAGIA